MAENEVESDTPGGLGDVLADPKRTRSDLKLVRRAVREGWNIPPEKRKGVVERLLTIVDKTVVAVMTTDGAIVVDGPADTNAIAAARVLVQMDGTDQADYWNEDKNARLDAGKVTERVEGVEIHIPGMGKVAG